MFPNDYSVGQPHLDEWVSRFERLQDQIQEFADELAAIETRYTDGPAGPWCGYLMRAKVALSDATMDFQELAMHRRPNAALDALQAQPEPSA